MSAFDPKRTLAISCSHPFQSTTAGCYGAVPSLGQAMSQRDKAGGKRVKTQRRRALKRRDTPKVGRTLPTADANQKIELLERKLNEALEQQTATSEVLQVISSSPGELQPVFQAMLEKAVRICDANFGNLYLREGDAFRIGATYGASPAYVEFLRTEQLFHLNPKVGLGRLVRTKELYQVADISAVPTHGEKLREATIKLAGARTLIALPMLKDNEVIGAIVIYRQEVRPFTDKQIELVKNFAAQAVIAIENTRLLQEQREFLERQTATAEVLRIISSSPGELQPVFDAMLQNATRICEATLGTLFLYKGDAFRAVAVHGDSYYADWSRREPDVNMRTDVHKGTPLERLTHTKKFLHIHDLRADEGYLSGNPRIKALVELAGARTHLVVPMLERTMSWSALSSSTARKCVRSATSRLSWCRTSPPRPSSPSRTRGCSTSCANSLQQQTATADVLKVISSSPGELETGVSGHARERGAALRRQVRRHVQVCRRRVSRHVLRRAIRQRT